ncbi:Hypothetical protein LUCI_1269 [Lucifera butyrica]|uniref:DUF2905 domain-containing protein n=1 Tax=Lucifera butyrica TaxID=1351585 RepID=A0A498RA76_9FIRM|nr:DUF2905 domain-containing protein [Lucifera butyrica]VBB06058.1 Hypothetical protein LUCI_1269 [Lucifera butyrica]
MSSFDSLGKLIMFTGFILLLLGAIIHFGGKFFPLGKLPGDISFVKGNVSFHFPIVTSIILSILLTIILNILR